MKKKQLVEVDEDELSLLKARLVAKIKTCNEADKLIAFLLMIDMSDKELEGVALAFKHKKGGSND